MAKGVSIGVSYALCGWLVQKYNGPQFGRPKPQRIRERVIFFNTSHQASMGLVQYIGGSRQAWRIGKKYIKKSKITNMAQGGVADTCT